MVVGFFCLVMLIFLSGESGCYLVPGSRPKLGEKWCRNSTQTCAIQIKQPLLRAVFCFLTRQSTKVAVDCLHNIQICMSCLVQVLCHNILVIIFWVIFWSMLTPLLLVAEWWRISFRGRMKQSPVTQSIVSDAVSIQSWRNYAIAIIGETADEIHRYGVSSN